MADITELRLQSAYSDVFRNNITAVRGYEEVNIHLFLAFMKYMLESVETPVVRTKYRIPDEFTFRDCQISVNNIRELQSSEADRAQDDELTEMIKGLQFNRLDGTVTMKSDSGSVQVLARLKSNPMGFGVTNGNLVLALNYEEKSRVHEIVLDDNSSSGLNEFQQALDGFVHNVAFRVDSKGHIRVAITAESPALYLYNDFVFERVEDQDKVFSAILTSVPHTRELGDIGVALPYVVLEFRPELSLLYVYTTMGLLNNNLPELETPLCAWKLPHVDEIEASDMESLIRELAEFIKIPKNSTAL